MIKKNKNHIYRARRHARVRGKVRGTNDRPRVTVFRSLRSIAVQLIDDVVGKTLAQANLKEIKKAKNDIVAAREVGKLLGERALKAGKKQAVFDRSGYRYHGRVKAVAEGIREAGVDM